MASINITVPDPVVSRVLDAFAAAYNRPEDSQLTKAQWAKQCVCRYVKEVVRAYEANLAAEAARQAALESADSDISLS